MQVMANESLKRAQRYSQISTLLVVAAGPLLLLALVAVLSWQPMLIGIAVGLTVLWVLVAGIMTRISPPHERD
ncbi:MAG: hypothetical protein KatS3mg008_2138 [Acidimicrobiales bacterium]|nr:MAG: hypothetical protein KatS3mg008_2138 [Acidimicrobiales bacterium]